MNQSSAVFFGLDPNQAYEISVGTETLSIGMQGPVSARVSATELPTLAIPDGTSSGSANILPIIIAVSVVFLITVLIIAISIVVVVLSRSRCSKVDLTNNLR